MKKLFISLPMNGRSEEEIQAKMAEYKKLTERVVKEETALINTCFEDFDINKDDLNAFIYYFEKSIQKMAEADFVLFDDSWRESGRCKAEYVIAQVYNIPMIRIYRDGANIIQVDLFMSTSEEVSE